MGNSVGLPSIMSSTVAPISVVEKQCSFPWLLQGTERELRVGPLGYAPG